MKSSANSLLIVTFASVLALASPEAQTGKPGIPFRPTTVESILRMGERDDGKLVQLHGRIISGAETSMFMDASECKGMKVSGCSTWIVFDHCVVVGVGSGGETCEKIVQDRSRLQAGTGERDLFVLDDVTVRGKALTVRRDVSYARSVPRSARIGFGHLDAYPAQISVAEIELSR